MLPLQFLDIIGQFQMADIKLIHKNSVPEWIINHLEEVFVDALPRNLKTTVEQLRWLQGQQIVIDYLKSLNKDDVEE